MIWGRRVKDDAGEPFERVPVDADGEDVEIGDFEGDEEEEQDLRQRLRDAIDDNPRNFSPPGPVLPGSRRQDRFGIRRG